MVQFILFVLVPYFPHLPSRIFCSESERNKALRMHASAAPGAKTGAAAATALE